MRASMTTIEAMKQADYVLASVLAISPDSITTARTALQDAIKREEAQTVEPPLFEAGEFGCINEMLNCEHPALFTHPAPAPRGERAALIAELMQAHDGHGIANLDVFKNAADMLAADSNLATNLMQVTAHRDHCLTVVDKLRVQQVAVPQGWKLVPVESTDEMLIAGVVVGDIGLQSKYRAMLAAAPQPQQAAEPCYCDKNGLGKPGVSCGDCPTRDYKSQPVDELTDDEIVKIAIASRGAESGRDGYILPITFSRAIIAAQKAKQ